jgi:ParB/RepB/Spo0J family partition protein
MTTERTIQLIDMTTIVPGDNGSGHQDRTVFDAGSLAELAGSIAAHGLLQPITLRPIGESELFCIVAGERRFRACELLGWLEIPAIVADVTADEAAALMLAENTSREDLNPVDEANAYQVRIDRLGWTVADCARAAGVSEARVLYRVKLLKLRPDLLELVRTGNLPLGYAQIIADGNLDTNRQLLALRALRNSPSPTPGWFRRQVGELLTQQAQAGMFDDGPLFGGLDFSEPAQRAFVIEPATPATVTAATIATWFAVIGNPRANRRGKPPA